MFIQGRHEIAHSKYCSLARVAGTLIFLFGFQYAGYSIGGVLYRAWRRGLLSATVFIDVTAVLGTLAPLLAVVIGLKIIEQRSLNKETLCSIGLVNNRWFGTFTLGIGIGMMLVAAGWGISLLRGEYHILGLYKHVDLRLFIPELIQLFLLALLGVICEELLFRGFILRTLEPVWGTGYALIFSAVAFGSYHGYYLSSDLIGRILDPVVQASVGGLLMGGAYIATRALWLPMGIHFGWNVLNALVFGSRNYGTHPMLPHTLHPTWSGLYIGLIPNVFVALLLVCYSVCLKRWRKPAIHGI